MTGSIFVPTVTSLLGVKIKKRARRRDETVFLVQSAKSHAPTVVTVLYHVANKGWVGAIVIHKPVEKGAISSHVS